MRALSNASGGLCFLVKSFEEGLTLFESEAVLSLRHRVPHKTPAIGGRKVEQLVEDVPYCQKPPFLLPPLLDAALARRKAAVPRSLASETVKRLSYELQQLLLEPEPCFEVASEDLSFWTVFFTGAAGTPYEQRCFLLFIDFELFPALAPEVRFVSPVYHCNVNNDGRSCLDVLSTWNPESSVRAILKEIAKLMACPNSHAAIDSVKGSLFQENRALYLSNAREWAAKHGKATSKDFLKK
jgi:ubiquitin-protein ligase